MLPRAAPKRTPEAAPSGQTARPLCRRPPRQWMDIPLTRGFATPRPEDLRRALDPGPVPARAAAPARAAPARPLRDEPLAQLATIFQGWPDATRLAQALWLVQRARQLARGGRHLRAQIRLDQALESKDDFFPAFVAWGELLRTLATGDGLWPCLRRLLDLLEKMPRVMVVHRWRLGLDSCGTLVYAEWAATHQLCGDRLGAAAKLRLALASHQRARELPEELQAFLVAADCLADQELAQDLERSLRLLEASPPPAGPAAGAEVFPRPRPALDPPLNTPPAPWAGRP